LRRPESTRLASQVKSKSKFTRPTIIANRTVVFAVLTIASSAKIKHESKNAATGSGFAHFGGLGAIACVVERDFQ
jgi:hypothetical protein